MSTFNGTSSADTLIGGTEDDTLLGLEGDDSIVGNLGNDYIDGGAGTNTIYGGLGADTIVGSGDIYTDDGSSPLEGGDVIVLSYQHFSQNGIYHILDFKAGVNGDVLSLQPLLEELAPASFDGINPLIDLVQYATNSSRVVNGNNSWLRIVDTPNGLSIEVDPSGANGGSAYQPIALLEGVLLNDLLSNNFDPPFNKNGSVFDANVTGSNNPDVINTLDGNDTITALDSGDLIRSGFGNDSINSGAGIDQVFGGAGNDTIIGGDDYNSQLNGGSGDDSIVGGGILYGEQGNDTLISSSGNDTLSGAEGQDSLSSGSGHDYLLGGADDDVLLSGTGADNLQGDAGDDLLVSGATNLVLNNVPANITFSVDLSDENGDTLAGGEGSDTLIASQQADLIDGGSGANVIYANAGNDTIQGSLSNWVNAGAGDDIVNLAGSSTVFGGDGNDRITSIGNINIIDAGAGDDVIEATGELTGGAGNDIFILNLANATQFGAYIINDFTLGGNQDSLDLYKIFQELREVGFTGNPTGWLRAVPDGNDVHIQVDKTGPGDGAGFTTFAILKNQAANLANLSSQDLAAALGLNNVSISAGLNQQVNAGLIDHYGTYTGKDGNDSLSGTGASEYIDGGFGNDSLLGNEGSDTLFGYFGNDVLDGGSDQDVLAGGTGNDTLYGGAGSDGNGSAGTKGLAFPYWSQYAINGGGLFGEEGNDELHGGLGADQLNGGTGNDTLYGDEDDDYVIDGSGTNLLDGGSGNDYISAGGSADTLLGADGEDTLYAGGANSRLFGDAGNDYVSSGGANSSLEGGDDDDTLNASGNNSTLLGGDGNDTLSVASSGNLINSGAGNDLISDTGNYSNFGNNTIAAGIGNDTITVYNGGSSIDAGDGDDLINIVSSYDNGSNSVTTGTGADIIKLQYQFYGSQNPVVITDFTVGAGGDRLDISALLAGLRNNQGYDYSNPFTSGWLLLEDDNGNTRLKVDMDAGGTESSFYTIAILNNVSASSIDLVQNFIPALGGNGVSITGTADADLIDGDNGIDSVVAGVGGDTIYGMAGDDTLAGGFGGNDSIEGGDGNDVIFGLSGDDTLIGDSSTSTLAGGSDFIVGGAGDDSIIGGNGSDFRYESIVYQEVSYYGGLLGEEGNDTILGGDGNDAINGGADNDSMSGGDGADQISGESGFDTLYGEAGNDYLYSNDGNDSFYGGTGDDNISATSANNYLEGNEGDDTLISGSDSYLDAGVGNDSISTNGGNNTIKGDDGNDTVFSESRGNDIDLGAGNDSLTSAALSDYELQIEIGQNTITAGLGNDTVTVYGAANEVDLGAGDDLVNLGTNLRGYSYSRSGSASVITGEGADKIVLYYNALTQTVLTPSIITDFTLGENGDKFDITDILVGLRENAGYDYGNPFTNGWMRFVQDGANTLFQIDENGATGGQQFKTIVILQNTVATDFYTRPDAENNFIPNISPSGISLPLTLNGGSGNDTLIGKDSNDTIQGSAGNDILDGAFGGNDSLIGGEGIDSLFGFSGDDILYGDSTDLNATGDRDFIAGGSGNDTIYGGAGDDSGFYLNYKGIQFGGPYQTLGLIGEAGDDLIYGGDGSDEIRGDEGNDSLYGDNGNDYLRGGSGNDIVHGDDGTDFLDDLEGNDSLNGGNGDDYLSASDGNDTLVGGTGNDNLSADSINNILYGDADDDNLSASNGISTLHGGDGTDTITAGGNSSITGDEGDDSITANGYYDSEQEAYSGNNTIDGGTGNDTIRVYEKLNQINAGDGDDLIYLGSEYQRGTANVITGNGSDTIVLYYNNITFQSNLPPVVIDDFATGAGGDKLDIRDILAGLRIQSSGLYDFSNPFTSGWMRFTQEYGDTLLQIDFSGGGFTESAYTIAVLKNVDASSFYTPNDGAANLIPAITPSGYASNLTLTGSLADDLLIGNDGHDTIEGDGGNDTLDGAFGGNDSMIGGTGQDKLFGFAGDDVLYGDNTTTSASGDSDFIAGGAGNDLIFGGDASDSLEGGTYKGLNYNNARGLLGEEGNDTIYGGDGQDYISGGAGNDSLLGESDDDDIKGGAGNDYISGGAGADQINDTEYSDSDTIFGGIGNDNIYVDGSNAYIDAGEDDDTLYLSVGSSTVLGGAGADQITLNDYQGYNSISGDEGNDNIQLSTNSQGYNTINSGVGDDTITVHGLSNQINAGDGNDQINLSNGGYTSYLGVADIVTGDGNDTISLHYSALSVNYARSTVSDFSLTTDKLDISSLLSSLENSHGYNPADNPFTTGWMRLTQDGADTLLEIDMSGNAQGTEFRTYFIFKNITATALTTDNFVPSLSGLSVSGNQLPTGITDTTLTLDEDQTISLNITSPTDPDSGNLTFKVVNTPYGELKLANGDQVYSGTTLTAAELEGLTYTPYSNLSGDGGSFVYSVIDDEGSVSYTLGNIAFTVNAVNDAPVSSSSFDNETIVPNQTYQKYVTYSDAEGDSYTVTVTLGNGQALPSWLSYNSETGLLSGIPGLADISESGVEVKFTATDGSATNTNSFTITIESDNTAPVLTTGLERETTIDINKAGEIPVYIINAGLDNNGFNYGVEDAEQSQIGVAITGFSGLTGGTIKYSTDAGESWITITDINVSETHALLLAGTNLLQYTAPENQTGAFNLTFRAWDGTGGYESGSYQDISEIGTGSYKPFSTSSATHTLTIEQLNDDPVALADSFSILENASVLTGSLSNLVTDADSTGGLLSFGLYDSVVGLTLSSTGSYTFDPSSYDSLTGGETVELVASYYVTDGQGGFSSNTLTITISGVNDSPVALADSNTATEDGSVITGNLASNDTDTDSSSLSYTLNNSVNGLSLNTDGSYSFDPSTYDSLAQGTSSELVATYTVSDELGATSVATLSITVTGVNDVPVANSDEADNASEDGSVVTGSVATNDIDADLNADLSYSLNNSIAGLSMSTTGSYSFNPASYDSLAEGEETVLTASYTVTDSFGASSVSTLSINVTGLNDAPVVSTAIADRVVAVNTTFDFTIANNTFSDVDNGDSLTYSITLEDGSDLPEGISYLVNEDGSITFSGLLTSSGITPIKITATDSGENSVSDIFNINVPTGTSGTGKDTLNGGEEDDYLTGGAGNDKIFGNGGDDILDGGAGADTLTGGIGNDTLDGGAGIDSMLGGAGDDVYIVDHAKDIVKELLSTDGTDEVQSSVSHKLGKFVENLTLTGTSLSKLSGTGNELANVISGDAGKNTLTGDKGNDTLVGNDGDDKLVGGKDIDSLDGGTGNDTLDGGTEVDIYIGGEGNDLFLLDSLSEIELTENIDEGTDSIQLKVNTGGSYTMADNIENLTLTGTGIINVTGNAVANTIIGNSQKNMIDGAEGSDSLTAGLGNDTLTGGSDDGFDTLDGGGGTDSMVGGAGDDTYYVDLAGDIIVELADEGTDTVYSKASSYTLADNVDNLIITGTVAGAATGNEDANELSGNVKNNTLKGMGGDDLLKGGDGVDKLEGGAGDDTLHGGKGADALTGGDGNDIFVFDTATKSNIDTIKDFVSGEDFIYLDSAIYTRLSEGLLDSENFLVGTKALEADDYLIYDNKTGKLFYDANGSGSGQMVQIAIFTKVGTPLAAPLLSEDDFMII